MTSPRHAVFNNLKVADVTPLTDDAVCITFDVPPATGHAPGKVRTFKGQSFTRADMLWAFPQPEPSPYQLEWDDLIDAIRNNTPYNETKRGAEASLVTSMGRMAAHTGQIIERDDILNSEHEFAPGLDKLTEDSPPPLIAGSDGKYPLPQPGVLKEREY